MTFSFKVFKISTVELTAPSATLIMLLPFCVFWLSWSRERICTRMRSEIAYSAAPSPAEFSFMPEDTFCRSLPRRRVFLFSSPSVIRVAVSCMIFIGIVPSPYGSFHRLRCHAEPFPPHIVSSFKSSHAGTCSASASWSKVISEILSSAARSILLK